MKTYTHATADEKKQAEILYAAYFNSAYSNFSSYGLYVPDDLNADTPPAYIYLYNLFSEDINEKKLLSCLKKYCTNHLVTPDSFPEKNANLLLGRLLSDPNKHSTIYGYLQEYHVHKSYINIIKVDNLPLSLSLLIEEEYPPTLLTHYKILNPDFWIALVARAGKGDHLYDEDLYETSMVDPFPWKNLPQPIKNIWTKVATRYHALKEQTEHKAAEKSYLRSNSPSNKTSSIWMPSFSYEATTFQRSAENFLATDLLTDDACASAPTDKQMLESKGITVPLKQMSSLQSATLYSPRPLSVQEIENQKIKELTVQLKKLESANADKKSKAAQKKETLDLLKQECKLLQNKRRGLEEQLLDSTETTEKIPPRFAV